MTDEQLLEMVNGHHRQFVGAFSKAVKEHARVAGQALLILKSRLKKGNWKAWVVKHFVGSYETAKLYMRIAKNWPAIEACGLDRDDVTLADLQWALSDSDGPSPSVKAKAKAAEKAKKRQGGTTEDNDTDDSSGGAKTKKKTKAKIPPEDIGGRVVEFPPVPSSAEGAAEYGKRMARLRRHYTDRTEGEIILLAIEYLDAAVTAEAEAGAGAEEEVTHAN